MSGGGGKILSKTAGSIPTAAARQLRNREDFERDRFLNENRRNIEPVNPRIREFNYTPIVRETQRNLQCRDLDGKINMDLVDHARNFIVSTFRVILLEHLKTLLSGEEMVLGSDELTDLTVNVFIRALSGKDRFQIEVFDLIRSSPAFEYLRPHVEGADVNDVPSSDDRYMEEAFHFITSENAAHLAMKTLRDGGRFNPPTKMKVIVIGDIDVGKTSLCVRLASNNFIQQGQQATINSHFVVNKTFQTNVGDNNIKVVLWDTAGQERFDALTQNYFVNALGVIIVYDCRESANVERHLRKAYEHGIHDIIVFGNKSDLLQGSPSSSSTDVVSSRGRESDGTIRYTGSAKTGENVNTAFDHLIQAIIERHTNFESHSPSSSERQDIFYVSEGTAATASSASASNQRQSGCC